jgi:transposase-like protein
LSKEDIVAIFVDGKTFAENEIVIALGVDINGTKSILGFVETSTENSVVINRFIRDLLDRGLKNENEILFIIDGSKGLRKGIKTAFKEKAIIQRCQWHKRENVVAYLPKEEQKRFRKKLQDAYNKPTYIAAKAEIEKIKKELKLMNESAVTSLEEGLEETLTLHRLNLIKEIGKSFKTTNCIESVNRQMEQYTGRVCYWKNSNQRQRWVATALTEIEPRLNKVSGHKYMELLRRQMRLLNEKAFGEESLVA